LKKNGGMPGIEKNNLTAESYYGRYMSNKNKKEGRT